MIVRTHPLPAPFDRALDRAFDQLVASFVEPRRPTAPLVDAAWNDDEYELTVDLPGVPASAVNVAVRGSTLELSVESLDWQRSIRLGSQLDPDKVTARYVDGRLTVRIGKVAAPTARQVEIVTDVAPAVAEADQPIDTTSTE